MSNSMRHLAALLVGALLLTSNSPALASSWDPTLVVNTESFQIIDDGDGTEEIQLQFGDSAAETLSWSGSLSAFTLSDDVDIDGNVSASGGLTINNDQSGDAALTFGNNLVNQTVTLAESDNTFQFSTGATFGGALSGQTLTISSLQNCDTIDTDANGNLVCGTDAQTNADDTFVDVIGDTMTGPLQIGVAINSGSGLQPDDASVSANLQLWLDADQLTGLIDGDAVTTWDDESGNGHTITQGTAGFRPTYETNEFDDKPVIRFDGVDDYLQDTTTSYDARTVFIVHRISTADQDAGELAQLWGHYGDGVQVAPDPRVSEDQFSFDGNGAAMGRCGTNGADYGASYVENGLACDWTYDTAEILATEFDANEALTQTTLGSLVPTFAVGAHQYGGDIAEIIVYDRVLTDTERQGIEGYLGAKYNIAVANGGSSPNNSSGSIALDLTSEATIAPALRLDIQGDSDSPHILFGSGGTFDVSLFRESAEQLQIDGSLNIASGGGLTVEALTTVSSLTGQTVAGFGLTDCDGDDDKLVWDDGTQQFSCETDANGSVFYAYDDVGTLNIDNNQQAIDLGEQVIADADYTHSDTVNSSVVTIETTGTYRISAQACVRTIDNTGGQRGEPQLRVQRDTGGGFNNIAGAFSIGYVREPQQINGENLNINVIQTLNTGDDIRMVITDARTTEPNAETVADCSRLLIERLR